MAALRRPHRRPIRCAVTDRVGRGPPLSWFRARRPCYGREEWPYFLFLFVLYYYFFFGFFFGFRSLSVCCFAFCRLRQPNRSSLSLSLSLLVSEEPARLLPLAFGLSVSASRGCECVQMRAIDRWIKIKAIAFFLSLVCFVW